MNKYYMAAIYSKQHIGLSFHFISSSEYEPNFGGPEILKSGFIVHGRYYFDKLKLKNRVEHNIVN